MTYYEAKHFVCEEVVGNNLIVRTMSKRKKPICGIDAIKMCVEALEKQIPKKPTEQGKSPDDENYKFGGCPICTATVFGDMHFCDNCGQSLDWSEEQ